MPEIFRADCLGLFGEAPGLVDAANFGTKMSRTKKKALIIVNAFDLGVAPIT